jgi:tetrahydromethanopterin S-methyltransferase subunit B
VEAEQETQQSEQIEEENYQEIERENSTVTKEQIEQNMRSEKDKDSTMTTNSVENRTNFFHGLAVGLGIGCIATFVIVWISIFFAPQMPSGITYENLLSIFIYPLMYLLAVGLVALTLGIVREYYSGSKV